MDAPPVREFRTGNAAGTAKSIADVRAACAAPVTDVTVGSITASARTGNAGVVYQYDAELRRSVNALGLLNLGWQWYRDALLVMRDLTMAAGKRLRCSVVGLDLGEWHELAAAAAVAELEVNLGCPNVYGPSGRKVMPSFDASLARDVLDAVDVPAWVKLSPGTPPAVLFVVAGWRHLSGIVFSNTVPDVPGLDHEHGELGGEGGAALLETNLEVVRELSRAGPVIGCGGVFGRDDVERYCEAGAVGCQWATAWREGIFRG